MLVSRSLRYLAASRYGLGEDEILDLLWLDDEVRQDFWLRSPQSPKSINALPVVIWSRLYLDLEPYLARRWADNKIVLSFYHRQVGEVAAGQFALPGDRLKVHERLAGYFESKADPAHDHSWTGRSIRGLSELPYHLIGAQKWSAVAAILTDIGFVEAKSHFGLVHDLLADYYKAEQAWPDQERSSARPALLKAYAEEMEQYASAPAARSMPQPPGTVELLPAEDQRHGGHEWAPLERLLAWHNMVSNHVVEFQDPEIPVFQTAYNDAEAGPVALAIAARLAISQAPGRCWVRRVNRPAWVEHPACLSTLELHGDRVTAVALSYDGRHGVSAGWDRTLQVWDLVLGVPCGTLVGHTTSVSCVAATPDCGLIVSGDDDGTVRLWDRDTRMCLQVFRGHMERLHSGEGHTGAVSSVSIVRTAGTSFREAATRPSGCGVRRRGHASRRSTAVARRAMRSPTYGSKP